MITPAASSNKKNKTVKVHPRKVMSSSNKRDHMSTCNAKFKHVVKDANSKFVCSTCNGCLFSANHDKCVVAYINDVNKRVKSKSGKSKKMEWKPTGKAFTSVGHRSSKSSSDLGKLKPKEDIGIFIGYAPAKKAYRIFNRRTRQIIETIHLDFDELTSMASEQSSLGSALHEMTPGTISSGLVQIGRIFLDGYGVLDVRINFLHIPSFNVGIKRLQDDS
ncbi:hypothetical protein Tco_1402641 [Tanacetum coccineum]